MKRIHSNSNIPFLRLNIFFIMVILIPGCKFKYMVDSEMGIESSGRISHKIIDNTGVRGGLIVHLGCGDSRLTAALGKDDRYLVHGLSRERDKVEEARKYIQSQGIYGRVSVEHWDKEYLPYTDNLVNLLVSESLGDISIEEVLRVLVPLGVAYIKEDGEWKKKVKPWPEEIDEWTHHLHGADGNPVARDKVVGPPEYFQWISGPWWSRSHETHSSINGVVTSNGRIFCLEDEAPISVTGNNSLPDKWFLKARDAFNGIFLWKVRVKDWGWREWKDNWFYARGTNIPLNKHRRVVAAGERVYATLGYHAPVSQLDACTGEVLQVYEGTDNTQEILYHEETLILTVSYEDSVKIMALDAESGNTLWESETGLLGTKAGGVKWKASRGIVKPAALNAVLNTATDGEIICFLDNNEIVGVDFDTGEELWRTRLEDGWGYNGKIWGEGSQIQGMGNLLAGTLIIYDDVVIHASIDKLVSLSLKTGDKLWEKPKKYLGWLWFAWKDVFVSQGLVWTWSPEMRGEEIRGHHEVWPLSIKGYDPHTGEIKEEISLKNIFKTPHHHRCYRNKATERYVISSRRGAEFINLEDGSLNVNNWVRGLCHYGMLPANGLLYALPHPCVCYIHEMIHGFNALASSISRKSATEAPVDSRVDPGPAYGKASGPSATSSDWPTYRHDPLRSGSIDVSGPRELDLEWDIKLGDRISSPVVVGDKLFVSLVDEYSVVALDVISGREIWKFTTGSRVDTPPTYYNGKVLFGSADGWVYCVRASDGEMVWRFRAAPGFRYIMDFGRLESAWPVHGSILIQNGVAYFAAGRSSHLDGGIYLYGVDPETGELLYRTHLEGPQRSFEDFQDNVDPPQGALVDILQGDGEHIYMRHLTFNSTLIEQEESGVRLRAIGGFLDDTYFKRAPWYFESSQNWGRIIVNNGPTFYAVKMFEKLQGLNPNIYFIPERKGYLLYAKTLGSDIPSAWSEYIPIRVKAMALTDDRLYIAGPPDVVDPEDPLAAFEGKKGGLLRIVFPGTGKNLGEYELDSPPVFNGMAVTESNLCLSTRDGRVLCFGSKR